MRKPVKCEHLLPIVTKGYTTATDDSSAGSCISVAPHRQKTKQLQEVRIIQAVAHLCHGICLPLSGATGFTLT